MLTRSLRTTCTFRRPFQVKGADRPQPAGTYDVETEEEARKGLSFLAYRRVSTLLIPRRRASGAAVEALQIDPADLAAALAADEG